jgi:superfamily I DNA/RNA helicase
MVLQIFSGLFEEKTNGFPFRRIIFICMHAYARENYPQQDQTEEERRLFYVAMTQAKEDLIIYTWEHARSRFIEEISEHTNEVRLRY